MVQDEKQTELCLRILQTCRAELCDLFPYLDAAFDCLRWRLGAKPGFSVDGQAMYFPVRETLECYSREPAALRRGYLHMLLHSAHRTAEPFLAPAAPVRRRVAGRRRYNRAAGAAPAGAGKCRKKRLL